MTAGRLGVDWRQVRLMLGAQRTAGRRPRPGDGAARLLRGARDVILAAVVPFAGVGAGRSLRGLEDEPLVSAGLHLVYFLAFGVLALGPLLGLGRSAVPDDARIAGLPVAPRTAFAAALGARLGSRTTLCVALAGACVLVGFGGGAGAVAWRLALLLLLVVCSVQLGHVLLLAFAGVLALRGGRAAGALLPFGAVALSLPMLRSVAEGSGSVVGVVRDFAGWGDWTVALPSWWAGSAATAVGPLDLAPAIGLPALAWWLLVAGGLLLQRAPDVSAPRAGRSRPGRGGARGHRFRGPLAATVGKDLRLMAREPALRAVLAPQAAFALLPVGLVLWTAAAAAAGEAGALRELARVYPLLPALGYTLVLLEAAFLLNLLGLEGRGVAHWLSLPQPRATLLVGKNVAILLTLGPLNAVLVGGTLLAAGAALGAPAPSVLGTAALAALEALCVLGCALAVGDVVSVLRPVRLTGRGRGTQALRSAGGGGGGGLLVGALGGAACALASLPVALMFHHPALLPGSSPAWLALTVPLAVAGSAGLVLLGARAAGALLASREELVRARMQ